MADPESSNNNPRSSTESFAHAERAAYKLLGISIILPPLVAAAAASGASITFLLVVGFAYFYLIIIVLPVAFTGLGIGYFLAWRKNLPPVTKLRHEIVGYLAGYATGLGFVFGYPLATLQNSLGYSLIVAGAFGGLIASFYISKMGVPDEKRKSLTLVYSPITNQYAKPAKIKGISSFRLGTLAILGCAAAFTILWPLIASTLNNLNISQPPNLRNQIAEENSPIPSLQVSAGCDIHNPNDFDLTILAQGFQSQQVTWGITDQIGSEPDIRSATVQGMINVNNPLTYHLEYTSGPLLPGTQHVVSATVGPDKYGQFDASSPRALAPFIVPEPCSLTIVHAVENLLVNVQAYNLTKAYGYDLDAKVEATIYSLKTNQSSAAKQCLESFIEEVDSKSKLINSTAPLSAQPLSDEFTERARDIIEAIGSGQQYVPFKPFVG